MDNGQREALFKLQHRNFRRYDSPERHKAKRLVFSREEQQPQTPKRQRDYFFLSTRSLINHSQKQSLLLRCWINTRGALSSPLGRRNEDHSWGQQQEERGLFFPIQEFDFILKGTPPSF
jgi:hypothetical protein